LSHTRGRGALKPAPFEFHAPAAVADAVGLLAEHGDEAKPLAGGQSLVPMLALRLARFAHLVDLNRLGELQRIEREDGTGGTPDGVVAVGAMARQATVGADPEVASAVPLLSRVTPLIGHFQIRNRGTLGGSIAHADPASEYPAVALALGAEMEVAGPTGSRRVAARDFFVSTWTTTLAADELLLAVRFPVWTGRCGFAVEEVARRAGDFALAGCVCGVSLDDAGRVTRAAIGLMGMGSTPVRAEGAEAALLGTDVSDGAPDLADVGELAAGEADPVDDVHASARYRRQVGGRLVTRALGRAVEEARRG